MASRSSRVAVFLTVRASVIGRSAAIKGRVALRQGQARDQLPAEANEFRFAEILSSEKLLKIENNSLFQNRELDYIGCIPSRPEGRIMIVTNVGRGAVDADVPKTNGMEAYGKDVWS